MKLISDGILNGDLLLIAVDPKYKTNDMLIVVADGIARIVRYKIQKAQEYLIYPLTQKEIILTSDLDVRGKMISLIRQY
jgi:SOS-response transcriptional repressor LexA